MRFSDTVATLTLKGIRSFEGTVQDIVDHAKENLSEGERISLAFKLFHYPSHAVNSYMRGLEKIGKLIIEE